MKITFLGSGTSQGIPVIGCECEVCSSLDYRDQRLRVSVHLQIENKSFVIDTGPDFRQQMLRERVKHLDAILFTHEHKDHTAGLDDVRAFNYIQKQAINVYGSEQVHALLKKDFSYAFESIKYPGVPEIQLQLITNQPFEIDGIKIIPIQVMHHKLPVFGFRVGDFTYITDANYISEAEQEKIKGSKVIVINGLQKEPHISHYTFDEAVALLHKWKPEKAYLTHISHKLGLHSEVEKELPEWIRLAYDGLQLEL